ncbi:MAG: helix-turn-helix transcriptional regulator [Gammaproteobacteria bacterium]|nr:helix-turn-helix transcriptional regulator [Gammaproteobacteria bacterium]
MLNSEKHDPFKKPISHVLDIIGENWSLLIIREAFFGVRRFEEFQSELGIARNILTSRLKKLCLNEILERVPIKEGAKRHEYVLTHKGKELMPVLIALTQWGDKWVFGENAEPVIFMDRENQEPIAKINVLSARGQRLRPREIMVRSGPGATFESKQRIESMNKNLVSSVEV